MLGSKAPAPKQRFSMSRISQKASHLSHYGGVQKPRFMLNDRSISSPRLKSFPAETIKRIDRSPIRNPARSFEMTSKMMNPGEGDTAPNFQHPQFPQSALMPNQQTSSDHQVSRSNYPMTNQVNQSEHAIPPSRMENSTIQSPHHRPFVPNHGNIIVRAHSPKLVQRPEAPNSAPQNHQVPTIGDAMDRSSAPTTADDPRKNIRIHRTLPESSYPNILSNTQQNVPAQGQNLMPSTPHPINPSSSNLAPVTHGTFPDYPEHPRPQLPHQMTHYGLSNNNFQRRPSVESSGMTSPQDIAINQFQNYQRYLQYGNQAYMMNQGNHWIPINTPVGMNNPTGSPNVPLYGDGRVFNGGVLEIPNQRPVGHWQYTPRPYYQGNGIPEKNAHQMQNNVNFNENIQCSEMRGQNQYENSANHFPHAGNQYYNTKNEPLGHNPQKTVANVEMGKHEKTIEQKRTPPRFTPAMIKDQELLVDTMRQQGIGEDIMRRQFEGLLNEQRKQLLYLERLEDSKSNEIVKPQENRKVQRKISKHEDGKPEWMMHITPPRIPYSVLEKMQSERQFDSWETAGKNSCQADGISENQYTQRPEIYNRGSTENYTQPWHMMNPNLSQPQQPQYSYVSNDANTFRENPNCYPSNGTPGQHQQRFYEYPVHHQQKPHHPNYEQQIPEKACQDNDKANFQPYKHEENSGIVNSSSLLKLRTYKVVTKRKQQNNGLQDPETIKEAMEALKNSAYRRGLEYLENLNKKQERPVSLNGTQDPEIVLVPNHQPPHVREPPRKTLSANGLENSRNPNNPMPQPTLRQRKIEEFQTAEFPRQRANAGNRHECYRFMAEKENGSVSTMTRYNTYGPTNVQMAPSPIDNDIRSHETHRQNPQVASVNAFNDKFAGNQNTSMSFPTNQNTSMSFPTDYNLQSQYNAQRYHGNWNNNPVNPENVYSPMTPGFFGNHPQELNYPCSNIQETIIVGGLKYIARKPEYSLTPNSAQNCQTGHGFNSMIACQ